MYMPRPPVDVAEGETGIGDCRIIDDRHKPRRIRHQGAVEQYLVAIREANQINVPFEIIGLCIEVLHHPFELPVEALHRLRQ
jgi:hypothetical protein